MDNKKKLHDTWYDLDNAATIYPSISDEKNTNVFRLYCEMYENIDKTTLQHAVNTALKSFDHFQVVMRRGLFWFYLESTRQTPKVEFESERPCGRLFYMNRKELMFRISYYRKRINLEVFHAVSDGTGALEFFRAIVYHYVLLTYPDSLPSPVPELDNQSPPTHRVQDAFSHHYDPDLKKTPSQRRAYTIGGTFFPGSNIGVICGSMPTKQILALSKSKGATLTEFVTALMICAIYVETMPVRARKKPIGVIVPVDLRNHFPSETTRNFFGVVDVSYNFNGEPFCEEHFEQVLQSVSKELREKVQPAALAGRMNYTMSVQKNVFARAVPLVLKNFVLRAAYNKSERATTSVISNLGRITMPSGFEQFIAHFGSLLNPTPIHRVKACLCSYNDQFIINFTSCLAETKIQKYFFRYLSANGVEVCITSNGVDDDEIL